MQSKSMQPPVSTSREALRCLLVGLHVSRTFLESLNCRRVRKMFVFSHSNQRENIAYIEFCSFSVIDAESSMTKTRDLSRYDYLRAS